MHEGWRQSAHLCKGGRKVLGLVRHGPSLLGLCGLGLVLLGRHVCGMLLLEESRLVVVLLCVCVRVCAELARKKYRGVVFNKFQLL